MDEFAFQSAVNLVKAIQDRKITSSELLELYIERHDRLNPRINAIVETDFENARIRARQADQALAKGENWGPLHGLPMTIKELIDVAGLHTTVGNPMLKENVATTNADAVQSLIEAGAIIFGKTNIPLGGQDTQSFNEVYGRTDNPWDVTRTPGGSSGGSAAALAAGLTGLEIGTDMGGSIRLPAHFCGVYGHKPTYGIVPLHGQKGEHHLFKMDYAPEIDLVVSGPLARSAADLDLVLDLVVRPPLPQRNAIKIDLPAPRKKSLKEYRIGLWIEDSFFPPDTEVGGCLQKMADRLSEAGARIEEKKPDIDIERCYALRAYLGLLAMLMTWPKNIFDRVMQKSKELDVTNQSLEALYDGIKSGELDDNDQNREAFFARIVSQTHREWLLLNAERSMMRQKWADYFKEFDVLLCPTTRIAAYLHDHTAVARRFTRFNNQDLRYEDLVSPWNALAGVSYLPATVAPVGFTSSGLPVGTQIVGPYLEDRTPIHFAKLIEETLGGFSPPPGFE